MDSKVEEEEAAVGTGWSQKGDPVACTEQLESLSSRGRLFALSPTRSQCETLVAESWGPAMLACGTIQVRSGSGKLTERKLQAGGSKDKAR